MKPTSILKSFPAIATMATLLAPAGSDAAVIAKYTFDTNQGNAGNASTFAPNAMASGITATSIVLGTGASTSNLSSSSPGSATNFHLNLNRGATVSTDATTARSTNTYAEFTLQPQAGNILNLRNQSLTFLLAAGGSSTRSTFLDVSLDGFMTFTNAGGPTDTSDNSQFTGFTYTLPDTAAYEAIASGTTVSFRFYEYAAAGSVRIDDITVNGSVVPEPSAALLGLLGVVPLLRRRR